MENVIQTGSHKRQIEYGYMCVLMQSYLSKFKGKATL